MFPEGFEEPPFGITVIWGKRKVGKTIAAINSPWGPVHVIDVEFSSEDYEKQMPKMIEMGIIKNEFTRASCLTYEEVQKEFKRIINSNDEYGTIVLDTVGQITEWKKQAVFSSASDAEKFKMSQIVWGKIRDDLRTTLFALLKKTKYLVMTAHEREYNGIISPRANPAILEIASVSIRLVKDMNKAIPDGILDVARLPMFPPRIPEFTITKLLDYMSKPADWNNLQDNETVTQEEISQSQDEPQEED